MDKQNVTQHYFITGASDGLGLALARLSLDRGHRVTAVVRDAEKMHRQLSDDRLSVLTLDLSKTAYVETLTPAYLGKFDVVINNAGATTFGSFEDLTIDQIRGIAEITLLAPLIISNAYLKASRPHSVLVNVTSITGQLPLNNNLVYSVCKGALGQLTAVLCRIQRKAISPRIIEYCPGSLKTSFHLNNKGASQAPSQLALSSKQAAEKLLRKIETGFEGTYYPDLVAKAISWASPRVSLFWSYFLK